MNETQGEWIPTGDMAEWYGELMKCSNCGDTTLDHFGNYCPSCGVKINPPFVEKEEQE